MKSKPDWLMGGSIVLILCITLAALWLTLDGISRNSRIQECPKFYCTCSCDGETSTLQVEPELGGVSLGGD